MKLFKRQQEATVTSPTIVCPRCGAPGSANIADLVSREVSYDCVSCLARWKIPLEVAREVEKSSK